MKTSVKAILGIVFILGVSFFGYTQYVSASQIEVSVSQSELLNEDKTGSNYNIELKFDNPSLLFLTTGQTEFFLNSDEKIIGKGELQSFTLFPLDSKNVKGTFHANFSEDEFDSVKISGKTKFDILFTSIDIPFVYYPTDEQAKKFINSK